MYIIKKKLCFLLNKNHGPSQLRYCSNVNIILIKSRSEKVWSPKGFLKNVRLNSHDSPEFSILNRLIELNDFRSSSFICRMRHDSRIRRLWSFWAIIMGEIVQAIYLSFLTNICQGRDQLLLVFYIA